MSLLHRQRLAADVLENEEPAHEHAHMDFPPNRDANQLAASQAQLAPVVTDVVVDPPKSLADLSDEELETELAKRLAAKKG